MMSQATFQPEERARRYRQLTDRAIALARASDWEEAVEVNRELVDSFPKEVSTLNRLGKALSETEQYTAARNAYQQALELDPDNTIARRQIERLGPLAEQEKSASAKKRGGGKKAAERIDPRLFIEETGKTGFTNLVDLARPEIINRLSAGDQVMLQRQGALLYVTSASGERIGRIEPRLAARLIKFMEGGNRYQAGIAELENGTVRIIIRETFQDPSQFGKVSFPAQGGGGTIRAYIKDTMVRYNQDEEDEFGEDTEFGDDGDDEDADNNEPELEEEGFMVSEE